MLKEKIKLRLEPDDEEKEAVGVLVAVTSCADGYVARGEGGGRCVNAGQHSRIVATFMTSEGGGGARERNRLRIFVTFKRLARLDDTIKIDFVFIFVLS